MTRATELDFLSPDLAVRTQGFEPRRVSALGRALRDVAGVRFRDLSLQQARIEARGALGELAGTELPGELVTVTPHRALLLCAASEADAARAALPRLADAVVDVTDAYACLEIEGERAATLMRRLADLDLARLPAAGPVARVPALVLGGGDAFRLLFPQEYGRYMAEAVVDTAEGLA